MNNSEIVDSNIDLVAQALKQTGATPEDSKGLYPDREVAEEAREKGWTYPERPIGAELRYVRCKFCHEMVQRAWTREGKPLYLDPVPVQQGKWLYRVVNRITGVYSQIGSGPGLKRHWCSEGSSLHKDRLAC